MAHAEPPEGNVDKSLFNLSILSTDAVSMVLTAFYFSILALKWCNSMLVAQPLYNFSFRLERVLYYLCVVIY